MKTQEGIGPVSAECIWVDRNLDEGWLVVDFRPLPEFRSAHVPGSVHVPADAVCEYELRLKIYSGGRPVACVVPPGPEGERAAHALAWMGLAEVRLLDGGTSAWSALGLPLVRDMPPAVDSGRVSAPTPFLGWALIAVGFLMAAAISPCYLTVSGVGWALLGPRPVREPAAARSLAMG